MRGLAGLLAVLAWLWAAPALAAIAAPTAIGNTNGTATSVSLSTTVDAPLAGTIFVSVQTASAGTVTATDTAGNSYTQVDFGIWTGTQHLRFFYSNNTGADLPGPCTVTASETSTTLVVTAVVTCSSADVLASGMAISGGSFTGTINGSCTLVAGAATCNVTGGSVVASGTATISSVIKIANTGASGLIALTAAYTTGIATTTPVDITGTMTTGTSTSNTTISPTVSTGTLGQANEIVIGTVVVATASSAYAGQAPFTDMTGSSGATTAVYWSYDIVAATTTVTYGPKWTSARLYGANVITFKGAGAAASGSSTGLLMGVQ